MTDPIADMFTRIRNAHAASKTSVVVPYSKVKHQLAEKLNQLGYCQQISTEGEGTRKTITIKLLYKNKLPVITSIKRISKPGRRIYVRNNKIPITLSHFGASLLTTSSGILTDKEAKAQGVGGELICQIW